MSEPTRPLPDVIYAQASPRSQGGRSLFELDSITEETALAATSDARTIADAVARLRERGFAVLHVSKTTINIAGPPGLYEEAFGCRLTTQPHELRNRQSDRPPRRFVECVGASMPGLIPGPGGDLDVIEGIAIEEPRIMFESPFAPQKAYWHLDVPAGVASGCNAEEAHRNAISGIDIDVAMVDSGHYAHPYFAQHSYNVKPVVLGPGAVDPTADANGHGTAQSANLFAVAPDVRLTMVKMSLVNSTGAFNTAVSAQPHIISCSWGSDNELGPLSAIDTALAAAISVAVNSGIIVVCAAGNGHFGFPGQHPDVISVGGTYMDANGDLQASDAASGFSSNIYPGRDVPDLTGLVGMKPRAAYIMLPTQPGSGTDQGCAANGAAHPNGDETAADDGWAALSGTSAAAPQIAGACALIKQANPNLVPSEVRTLLMNNARDVTQGRCFNRPGMDHPAMVGPDLATGHGLVNTSAAALEARNRAYYCSIRGIC